MRSLIFITSLAFFSIAIADRSFSNQHSHLHHSLPTLILRQTENLTTTLNFTATPLQGKYVKDRTYVKPYIDIDEWRDTPIRHRFMHGGFKH